jgi:hypothetical protein
MAAQTFGIRKFAGPHAGRTMVVEEPVPVRPGVYRAKPLLVTLKLRAAESAPKGTRVKAGFQMELPGGVQATMPIAASTIGLPGASVEFRLESN